MQAFGRDAVATRNLAGQPAEQVTTTTRATRSAPRFASVTAPDADALRWWADGERAVADRIDQLSDDALGEPSRLPGWSRAHVVAHLARNADALGNLLSWARTGVESPMYPSREARDADIAATAALSPAQLRADYAAACDRLPEAIETTSAEAWTASVRTMQGKTVPATDVPWMRAKEIWVHGVDLDAGLTFADLPADFCTRLVDDVLGVFAEREQSPAVTVVATDVDRAWGSGGPAVHGPVTALAAWLTRGDAAGLTGEVPPPPRWL
jgi:maleylpyruvate isomerase